MAQFPWDDDGEGRDEVRREVEARLQGALAEVKAHITAIVEKARDELLQLAAAQGAALAALEARMARLEARQDNAWD